MNLYDIEHGLHEALTVWQEAQTPEEMEAAELALDTYLKAEVAKVDGVRQYIKHCDTMAAEAKAEARVQAERAQAWSARKDRLKAFVQGVMESTGQKRLEGRHGSIVLKGNGGKQAVTIADEALVPDEYSVMTGTIPAWLWFSIEHTLHMLGAKHGGEKAQEAYLEMGRCAGLKRAPSLSLISAALERGQGIPGCRLEPRGQHVEVK